MKKFLQRSILFFLLPLLFSSCARTTYLGVRADTPVPDFTLTSTEGSAFQLSSHTHETVVLIFWSSSCPITKAYENRIRKLYDEFALKGVAFFGVASNDSDSDRQIREASINRDIPFPILLDRGAKTAGLLGAEKTPELFIVAPGGQLTYRGAIDNETWARHQPTTHYVHDALSAVLKGEQIRIKETEPYGKKIIRQVA